MPILARIDAWHEHYLSGAPQLIIPFWSCLSDCLSQPAGLAPAAEPGALSGLKYLLATFANLRVPAGLRGTALSARNWPFLFEDELLNVRYPTSIANW